MEERFVLRDFNVDLEYADVCQKLHLQDEDADLMLPIFNEAVDIAVPKAVYTEDYVDSIAGSRVTIGGHAFESEVMSRNLADVHRVFPYVVTCGTEVDDWSHGQSDYFISIWLDMIKEMILGCALDQFERLIKDRYGLSRTGAMSPGSGDADVWPISQQVPLFELIGGVQRDTGARLTEGFLMVPTKSVSGIIFPSATEYVSCTRCRRKNCRNRRAPCDPDWNL